MVLKYRWFLESNHYQEEATGDWWSQINVLPARVPQLAATMNWIHTWSISNCSCSASSSVSSLILGSLSSCSTSLASFAARSAFCRSSASWRALFSFWALWASLLWRLNVSVISWNKGPGETTYDLVFSGSQYDSLSLAPEEQQQEQAKAPSLTWLRRRWWLNLGWKVMPTITVTQLLLRYQRRTKPHQPLENSSQVLPTPKKSYQPHRGAMRQELHWQGIMHKSLLFHPWILTMGMQLLEVPNSNQKLFAMTYLSCPTPTSGQCSESKPRVQTFVHNSEGRDYGPRL